LKLLRTARAGRAAEPGTLLDDDGTIACAVGAVKLLQVQRAGKGPMSAQEFLRGARLSAGSKL
jgi:methionyl-tRNA formyltransferase